jgi:hypothetical protein
MTALDGWRTTRIPETNSALWNCPHPDVVFDRPLEAINLLRPLMVATGERIG